MKLKQAYKRNLTDINNKLPDVTSNYADLQSLHDEVIEKYDQNKEDIEKQISILALENNN